MKYCFRFCFFLFILILDCRNSDARQQPADTNAIHTWLKIATQKLDANEPDSAEYYILKANARAKELNLTKERIKCLGNYANLLFSRLRYKEALQVSQEQLSISQQSGNYAGAANAYNNMSIQYRSLGQLQLAAESMLKGIRLIEGLKDSVNLRKYYNNLASVFLDLGDARNSLYYSRKSVAIAMALKDTLLTARSMINLASSEVLDNKYDSAIAHLKQVINIAKSKEDADLLLYSYINVGEIYNKIMQPHIAITYYEKASAMLKKEPNTDFQMYTDYGMAYSYYNLNEPVLAKKYLDKVIVPAGELMPKNDLKEVYQLGSKINEQLNNASEALKFLKRYTALNDSIINEKTQKTIHEAEIKFQSSNKEKAIVQQQLLISNKNIELQKKNRLILISIVAITLLVSGCIIIYLIYRNKNQLIELSLLKAQIHPHFLFNTLNNLYALTLNKSDQSPGVVMELSHILRYILYECNTTTVSLEKELKMIERYISLEKIRYGNHLEVNMSLSGNLENHNIVPLLLLPLVENAFKHGIGKLAEEGWINISAGIKDNRFTFKISNNKLPSADGNAQRSDYGNIGLYNIRKRLDILYRGKYDLKIIDEEDVFVVVMKIELEPNKAGRM
ncbi:Putative regulator of cell autolysis [Chitinophaga terrae (ex Kim and Jung 2007)]|uniref:Putative regulator of cell autolysis n=1 Tax=Chitinophaga terrae (ex Kim and Jung 2007) TaxID=408074 RepID=A0A1H4CQS3_9BACT|nr:histidine kinase [Chitinophaga terrae (ex Kim and Jung 2007)]GEP90391.1 hypothetical protein CTE07_20360 [Chitinophaga terrae (ex Kim and Jung 2007)]SEA62638.1 Putative regulator of cell autolysis [Chitinophaga terrae (ex Kim and Jung 2007)]